MSEEDFAHTTSVELFYNSVMRELFWEQTAHLAVLGIQLQRDDIDNGTEDWRIPHDNRSRSFDEFLL
jgi:hypothetical protein